MIKLHLNQIVIERSLHARRIQTRQSGATMIEILVAVLILSFGLLGMAALQTRALQGNQSSIQRSQAVMLANYMMDAMRIDAVSARSGNYNITNICGPSGVSGNTLSSNNIRDWLTTAQENIAGSAAASPVCGSINCTAGLVCTVRITWDDSKSGGLADQAVQIQSTL
jgi:type IV pilus assembly protein PilV